MKFACLALVALSVLAPGCVPAGDDLGPGSGYQVQAVGEKTYFIVLEMAEGGDGGTPRAYFARRAQKVAAERGCGSYDIVDLRADESQSTDYAPESSPAEPAQTTHRTVVYGTIRCAS